LTQEELDKLGGLEKYKKGEGDDTLTCFCSDDIEDG